MSDMLGSDQAAMRRLDTELMKRGQYVLPGVRRFVSTVHTDQDLEEAADLWARESALAAGIPAAVIDGTRRMGLDTSRIEVTEMSFGSGCPRFIDAFAQEACWEDGTPLTDAQVDDLNQNHGDFIHEEALRLFY